MYNLSQKHTKLTTLYLLGTKTDDLVPQLRRNMKRKKPVLVVPTLATEFTQDENRPVFLNIVRHLRRVTYLHKIIFGLDGATDEEAFELADILRKAGMKNVIIQHNRGEEFTALYTKLTDAGFNLDQPGKGRNMFMSFGIAQALGAQCIGVLDADIKTFNRRQLDRLFYPVIVRDYEFSKAFYARISEGQMYGRVKRLLLDPLLIALKRKFSEFGDNKFLRLADYLLAFNYQLSGEVAFDMSLLRRMHFATNWGVEIFTLIEVYRKANNIAQVQFSRKAFDHKHQSASIDDRERGLYRMAIDIVTTIFSSLVVEEGLEITEYFIQDLTITYRTVAEELVKKYADNSAFSGLHYDRNAEEALVRTIFTEAILTAGDQLISPSRMTDRFLRILMSDDRFQKYLDMGLQEDMVAFERDNRYQLFEVPQTVSWERIITKLPRVLLDIGEAVKREQKRFS